MTAIGVTRVLVPALALALACAGRERAAPLRAGTPDASRAPSTAAVQHDLHVALVPERRTVLVEDEVFAPPPAPRR